jgi:ethanolamine permease
LCVLTGLSSVGVAGWEAIVYPSPGADPSDSPLPLALGFIVGKESYLFHLLLTIGLLGLVASFHGIILAAGRATFEFGRVGFAPRALGKIHAKFRTPAIALIANMFVGICALLTGKTGEIITIACFGAINLYIISMIALLVLRRTQPNLERPFKVPGYPFTPIVALVIASVCMVAMAYYNLNLFAIYLALLAIASIWFFARVHKVR